MVSNTLSFYEGVFVYGNTRHIAETQTTTITRTRLRLCRFLLHYNLCTSSASTPWLIDNGTVHLNGPGGLVDYWWNELQTYFCMIRLDSYIIMPNHIHGIIQIIPTRDDRRVVPPHEYSRSGRTHRSTPTIPKIVQWFKTMTTNAYINGVRNENWVRFDKHLWQRPCYDHIIRNEADLYRIREYIRTNPEH